MLTRAQASTAMYAASRKMIGRAADAAKAATWRIYQYTRSQAVADGFQIEVTKTAGEAGNRHEVAHRGCNHIGHHRLPGCVPTPGTKSDLHEWITPLGDSCAAHELPALSSA